MFHTVMESKPNKGRGTENCALTMDVQLNASVTLHLKITFIDKKWPTVLSFVPVTMTCIIDHELGIRHPFSPSDHSRFQSPHSRHFTKMLPIRNTLFALEQYE